MDSEVAIISLLGVVCLILLVSVINTHLAKIKALKKEAAELQVEAPLPLPVPEKLGIRVGGKMESKVKELENAIDPDYFAHVKERLLAKEALEPHEYDLYLMEMKRYLVLTTFMESVPMYNDKVDRIWHEMILFTKSYSRFCNSYAGRMIHHEPNMNPVPNPFERELFEFTYMNLFEPHAYTEEIYPRLQKSYFSEAFLHEVDELSPLAFINKHYSPLGENEKGLLYNILVQSKNEWSRHRMNTAEPEKAIRPKQAETGKVGVFQEPKAFLAESLFYQSAQAAEPEKVELKKAEEKKEDDTASFAPVFPVMDSTPSKSKSSGYDYSDSNSSNYDSGSSSSSSDSGSSSSCGSSCSS